MQGFPNYVTEASVEVDGFACGKGRGRVTAGAFSLGPLQPPLLTPVALDSVPLNGISFQQRDGDRQFGLFFGRPEYPYGPPGVEFATPWLAGARWLDRFDRNWFEFALTAIDRPTYLTDERRTLDGVASGMVLRELSPWVSVFGELQGNALGSVAERVGIQQRLQRGELRASLYRFGRDFPFIYPLYRPGETGIEVNARFDPSEVSALFATIDLVDDPLLNKRREVRGSAGFSESFGTNRPSVTLTYSRNELVFDARSIADRTQFGNRLAASVSRGTSAELVDLTVERLWGAQGGSPDRTQGVLNVRRVVGPSSLLSGWAVFQKESGLGWGVTTEGTLELPARGRLSAIAGLGAAYLDRPDGRTAQGEVVLGLSRRLLRDGLSLRLEVRLPFDVGVPSSRLLGRRASLDLGYRLGWKRLDQLFASMGITPPGMKIGTVEGVVEMAGRGLAGVRILIDGEPRATSRGDGSFRVTGVTAGTVVVQVDPASLEPRISVIGGASREVALAPKGVGRVRFELAEFSYFQGSVVTCEEGPLRAVAGAAVTLRSADYSATILTNALGGFQFEGIPPGSYRVSVDVGQASPALKSPSPESFQLDLSQDVAGFVIRLHCP